ncbi:hypothetical protein [Tepidibacillus decaturensis]|uniref:Uncharacterized protein n=1 Tax=Tepidibacillus decaturensis TaxID=1413211 RepID=A0A135L418_9BACI|nr:hypothetical protein [Tepidibacillus decaturensis]KXG43639.1 hypothetical protein U473_06125 [Tepidibacillus decaturensis]
MHAYKHVSKGMVAALTLSVIIAFMISLIPNAKIAQINYDLPVFKIQKNMVLSNDNLVDFISSIPLHLPIKKVIWDHNTLSVDLTLTSDEVLDTEVVYLDLFTLIQKGFVEKNNVNEIFIRVFLKDSEKIFVATSAKKEDIMNNRTMKLGSSMSNKDFLDQYFGLNYGNAIR